MERGIAFGISTHGVLLLAPGHAPQHDDQRKVPLGGRSVEGVSIVLHRHDAWVGVGVVVVVCRWWCW